MAVCPDGCDFASDEEVIATLAGDIRRYFAGERVDLTRHPVDLSERPRFSQRVLAAARRIPYGRVRTYAWVATQVGKPGAARAVGQVMRRNPLPLLIPCHRVVGARGELTGFGGGLPLKRALLMLEGLRCQGDRVVLD